MAEKYIHASWESYRKLVVPDGASETQVIETRQAFFSGASVLFGLLMKMLETECDGPDIENDLEKMSDIGKELMSFGQDLDKKLFNLTMH